MFLKLILHIPVGLAIMFYVPPQGPYGYLDNRVLTFDASPFASNIYMFRVPPSGRLEILTHNWSGDPDSRVGWRRTQYVDPELAQHPREVLAEERRLLAKQYVFDTDERASGKEVNKVLTGKERRWCSPC